MRLITSVCLQPEDVQAIQNGLNLEQVCEKRLLTQIRTEFSYPAGKGSVLLTSLLAVGRLELRIAMPKQGNGIYHEKVGIFEDNSDYVAFSGSSNESRSGLEVNYECVDIFTSWQDKARAEAKRRHFEHLWAGTAPGVHTFTFPESMDRYR